MPNNANVPGNVTTYRQQILQQLLENKEGMQIDELSKFLNISRTAVQKHFLTLEKEGLIKKHNRLKTLGRPSINYVLTGKGIAYFPKRYALFSGILLQELLNEMGSERLNTYMEKLGKKLAQQYLSRFEGQTDDQKIDTLFGLMQELGFYPDLQHDYAIKAVEIKAHNCIFHDLAQQFQEICSLDRALIEALTNAKPELHSCMAKGDGVCCFRLALAKNRTS